MYPRPGRRLLPRALAPLFGTRPIHTRTARRFGLPASATLGDLDESVWRGRSPEEVRQLAAEVVRAVSQTLPRDLAELTLFEHRPRIDDLELSVRTRNALHYARLVESGRLLPTTVGAVWSIPTFGAVSLLDLLTALDATEPLLTSGVGAGDELATPSRAVRVAASALARKRWAGQITAQDPRVGNRLLALDPSARTPREAAARLANAKYTPSQAKRTAAAIRVFTRDLDALRRLGLGVELAQIVNALVERETAQTAVLARTGLSGAEPTTLEAASQIVGVTRERVRQIEKKFRDRVATCDAIWTPVLDRALQTAAELLPARPSVIEEALARAGITTDFSLASLIAAATIFGKELPFAEIGEILAPPGNWAPPSAIRNISRRLVEHWGATTIAELELQLRDAGFDVEPDLLAISIETLDSFAWLDEERGWFWVRGARNRLLNQVKKVVSVAGTIELGELRAGVGRHHRMKGFRPPREVLASICLQSGDYYRDGDRICAGPDLEDWTKVLVGNERTLVQALFDFGPVMRRDDLERVVVTERGLNRNSFGIYLTYAPMIERYAPGVFGLRGASVTAAEVDAMIPQRVRHQVLQDQGWTDDGKIWAAFRISPAAARTGILGTPAAIRSVTRGAYELFAEDDRPVGTLVIDQNMWGFSPFFRRWGVEPGDLVVITLDLSSRLSTIAVGTDELLLRFQAGE